jgi:hypothetical protein
VEWGYTRSYGYQTTEATDSTTRHEVVVAGPAPGETIHWRVRSTVDGTPCVSDDQTTTIGTDRSPLTNLTLNTSTSGFTPGFRVVPLAGGTPGVAIVDDEGRQVWWHAPDAGLSAVQSWLSADGTHVMYMVEDSDRSDDIGGLVTVSLDQTDVQFYPLHYCHHSFTPLADGRIAYLATDPENYHGDIVAGDDVMIANADGSDAHSIFNTWDNWVPDMNRVQTEGGHYYPNWLDWTHGNSLNQRADGTLLVSFHGIDTVINLSLDGTLNWTMGGQDPGAGSDFTYSGSTTDLFSHQHQPVDVGGNLLIFNNGTGARGTYSQAVEYEIDESRHTFTPTWTFDWDGSQVVQLEGDVQRMPNGNTLIDWGSNGFLTEVTPAGDIVWQISSGGNILGFLQQYPMIGGPT